MKPGDTVTYRWEDGGAHHGIVIEVEADHVTLETRFGNRITRLADELKPAKNPRPTLFTVWRCSVCECPQYVPDRAAAFDLEHFDPIGEPCGGSFVHVRDVYFPNREAYEARK
jgi:hypothetical protein